MGQMANRHPARPLADTGFHEFRRPHEYGAAMRGGVSGCGGAPARPRQDRLSLRAQARPPAAVGARVGAAGPRHDP